jgi:hypothetical protein
MPRWLTKVACRRETRGPRAEAAGPARDARRAWAVLSGRPGARSPLPGVRAPGRGGVEAVPVPAEQRRRINPSRYGFVSRRATLIGLLLLVGGAPLAGQSSRSLLGTHEKMERQHAVADSNAYPFLQTAADVNQFAELGVLVPVDSSVELKLSKVSFPVTRPAVRTFVRRLAHQYFAACGQPLVVTSLTRPLDEQPDNASELSVHPAGMAVDIGRAPQRACRRWLERTLLALQGQGVVEATREQHPAHYHVAVYPHRYLAFLDRLGEDDSGAAPPDAAAVAHTRLASSRAAQRSATYRVQPGDTLGRIAARHGVTVAALKRVNGLRSSLIAPGQVLRIPIST